MASFYSNSSLMSSDLQSLSKKNAFNDMLTVGLLWSDIDIYVVHRYVVQLSTFSEITFVCSTWVCLHNDYLFLLLHLYSLSTVHCSHSCTLLQATLALLLVVSLLKSVCCDFSIFSAMMPQSPAPCLTWYGIPSYTHHLL